MVMIMSKGIGGPKMGETSGTARSDRTPSSGLLIFGQDKFLDSVLLFFCTG